MTEPIPIQTQTSAGGVAFRRLGERIEVALISVGDERRWQLPKGLVEVDEDPQVTARREVREETGLNTCMVRPIDTIEYWYSTVRHGKRIRYHKFVHFYLLEFTGGQLSDHDHEVNEARWFEINEALVSLKFDNEKKVLRRALEQIQSQSASAAVEEAE